MQTLCKMLWIFVFAVLFTNFTYSNDYNYTTAPVGKQPAYLFGEDMQYYVFCLGFDANYDGNYDEETDEVPSLWSIRYEPSIANGDSTDIPFAVEKICDFQFGFPGFPFRPAVQNGYIYFYQNGLVKKIDVATGLQTDTYEFEHSVYGLSISGDILYVSTRKTPPGAWVPEDNYVIIYNMTTKQALDTIPAKMNVQMTRIIDNELILVLNEGLGGDDSFVTLHTLYPEEIGKYDEIQVFLAGSFGNYFTLDKQNNNLFVVSNGSHKIYQYSLHEDGPPIEYNLPTTGYDGPREIAINEDAGLLRVTAYDGKVYEFALENNEVLQVFEAGNKCESMIWSISPAIFMTTNISKADYTADELVSIWWSNYSSVADYETNISIYPNPTTDYLNIESVEKYDVYEVFTIEGRKVASEDFISIGNPFRIDLSRYNLNSGNYILLLHSGDKRKMGSFKIIK